jgi:hypothetical protein
VTLITGFDLCRAAMSAPGVTAPERSVLMVLAIMANGEAKCWPPINDSEDGAGLTTRCVLSERAVQRAIQQLVRLGHISRRQLRHGVIYTVHPAASLTPVTETGVSETGASETGDTAAGDSKALRPATVAPKLPKTTIPPKVAGKHDAAGTLVPLDFTPIVKPDSITGKAMAAWPPGLEAEQVEHFIDRHTTQGTKSLDWQASWRTWVKNWKSFNGKRTHDRRPAYRGNDLTPMARALVEREAGRSGAWD